MDQCRLVAVAHEWIWEAETLGGGAVSMLPLLGMIPGGSCDEMKEERKEEEKRRGVCGGGM